MKNAGIAIAAFAGTVALVIAASIWGGFATSILWGWFVVEQFGAPPLSIPQAIGLGVVVHCFNWQRATKDDLEEEVGRRNGNSRIIRQFLRLAITPGALLLTGWIVRWFL